MKGLRLQLKKFGNESEIEYAAYKISFLTSTVANDRPLSH